MSGDTKNDAKNAIGQNGVRALFACFFIFQSAKKVAGDLAADNGLFYSAF